MKVQFYVVRENLYPDTPEADRIFFRNMRDGNPIGPEMSMLRDEWDKESLLQVGGKKSRVFEHEITVVEQKELAEREERIDWLMNPKDIVFLVQIVNKKIDPYDVENMFRLGGISKKYCRKFKKSPFDFSQDLRLLPEILLSKFSEIK